MKFVFLFIFIFLYIHIYLHFKINPMNELNTIQDICKLEVSNTCYYKLPFIFDGSTIIKDVQLNNCTKQDNKYIKAYESLPLIEPYVKFFTKKRACEECFMRQSAAHYLGFGPKALFTGKKKGYYYYVTEHAQLGKVNREQMYKLRKQIERMGWATFDLFSDNVGKINGKPVLIDFDSCTLG